MTVNSLRRRNARATFKVDEPIEIKIGLHRELSVSRKVSNRPFSCKVGAGTLIKWSV